MKVKDLNLEGFCVFFRKQVFFKNLLFEIFKYEGAGVGKKK